MTPTQTPTATLAGSAPTECGDRALALLDRHGASPESIPGGATPASASDRQAAVVTALMDLYRRTGAPDVFECLVERATPQLWGRVRSRLRGLGSQFDPHEILQDVFVNIYRYPDRFQASRPGAFAAWSSTIVDNAIRRQLRRSQPQAATAHVPSERLEQIDAHSPEPCHLAVEHEESEATARAFQLVLSTYLMAFQQLSERERFVLQMVEVRGMRYAQLAGVLGIRPEALKMVVFRARKRVFDRIDRLMRGATPARCAG